MILCNICGAPNLDTDLVCKECSSPLPIQNVKKGKNKARKQKNAAKKGFRLSGKTLGVFAAAAAVVGAVALGAVFHGGRPAKVLGESLSKNESAILEQIDRLENLSSFLDNAVELNDQGDFALSANMETDVLELAGSVDYSRSERVMSGTLDYEKQEKELNLKFAFSADHKNFTLASDRTDDIYGFKLKEFAKKYHKSPLAKIFPIVEKGKELNLDLFKKQTGSKTMKQKYGDVWNDFVKSVEYKEVNERVMQIGSREVDCRVYDISWDTKAATKLLNAILGTDRSIISRLSELFEKLGSDCRIYTDETGYIVAVDYVIAGKKCTLTVVDADDHCLKYLLQTENISAAEGDIRGELEITDDNIRGDLKWDGMMEVNLTYTDQTGEFRFVADLLGVHWDIAGKIASVANGAQLMVGGYIPEYGDISLYLEQTPLTHKPEMMSDKYVDLLELDLRKLERLLIDINNTD